MINKLHKIKIEKGMMNTGILSNINNRIKQFKKSYLPLVFNVPYYLKVMEVSQETVHVTVFAQEEEIEQNDNTVGDVE